MENNIGQKQFFNIVKPWITSVLLLPVIIYFSFSESKFHFIDYLNLLIHEGGHGIFSFFGRFVYTLGGTIAQIIIPGMLAVYYFLHKRKILTQIFLLWLGENFINIGIYAADARARRLPLLGGNKVYHDWTYLLNQTGLILYDLEVGRFFYWMGIAVFIAAVLIPLFIKPINNANFNLDL